MRKFFTPTQDAALYEEVPTRNAGLDEILEVGKTLHGSKSVHSLIQFDIAALSASISNGQVSSTAQFELLLYVAQADSLKAKQQVWVCQTSQSWDEGTGYYYQDLVQTSDGATWTWNASGSSWSSGSAGGSIVPSSLIVSSSAGQPLKDFSFDVTVHVAAWVSGAVNSGFLVKFDTASEADPKNQGNIKFFSKDTHTIYKPQLIAKWNDQVYATGSLLAAPTTGLLVVAQPKGTYRVGETVRVAIAAREQYPLKTFNTILTAYDGIKALPTTSYFSIVDEQSGAVIIPFDDNSRVSCDSNGSYVKFDIANMFPLRWYRILIRVDHDGLSEIFDNNSVFKVI